MGYPYSHGIFPATSCLAFSVELIYHWITEICASTRAFRSAYSSTNKLQFTPGYTRRYATGRMAKVNGWHKANRRNSNDAVRRFIVLIDIDSKTVAGQLFTCSKCEVPMVPRDFKQIGLDPIVHEGLKRLHSVVIDAKVIGLL